MKKYTTPKLQVLELVSESILCLSDDLGSSFENWNEEDFSWDE